MSILLRLVMLAVIWTWIFIWFQLVRYEYGHGSYFILFPSDFKEHGWSILTNTIKKNPDSTYVPPLDMVSKFYISFGAIPVIMVAALMQQSFPSWEYAGMVGEILIIIIVFTTLFTIVEIFCKPKIEHQQ